MIAKTTNVKMGLSVLMEQMTTPVPVQMVILENIVRQKSTNAAVIRARMGLSVLMISMEWCALV